MEGTTSAMAHPITDYYGTNPLLSFHPDGKGERTSMLIPNVPVAAVWRDDADSDEKRLFKMVEVGSHGAELRFSANGIEWGEAQKLPDWGEVKHPQAIVPPDGKSTSLYWHRASKKGGSTGGTDVMISSSADRIHWSAPQIVAESWLSGKTVHSFAASPCGGVTLLMAGLIDEAGKETTQGAMAGSSKRLEDLGTLPGLPGNAQSVVPLRDALKLYFTRTINGFQTLNVASFPTERALWPRAGWNRGNGNVDHPGTSASSGGEADPPRDGVGGNRRIGGNRAPQ